MGMHDCTPKEIKARFGTFQRSDRRPRLAAKLETFLLEAAKTGLVAAVVVDGSFVTATPEPNDIDLIIALVPGHSFTADLSSGAYDVLSKTARAPAIWL